MQKKPLRLTLRERLAALSQTEMRDKSRQACSNFLAQPEYAKAEILMIFLPMTQEVDTSAIALQAWSDMKRVLAPLVSWDQRRMLPIEISSLESDLRVTQFGLREPVGGMPIPVFDIDLVVVPGLGFDTKGNRLGRGRGFYDRFLSHRDFRGTTVALAFECQVVERVPSEPHDVRVDMLVTDESVWRFTK